MISLLLLSSPLISSPLPNIWLIVRATRGQRSLFSFHLSVLDGGGGERPSVPQAYDTASDLLISFLWSLAGVSLFQPGPLGPWDIRPSDCHRCDSKQPLTNTPLHITHHTESSAVTHGDSMIDICTFVPVAWCKNKHSGTLWIWVLWVATCVSCSTSPLERSAQRKEDMKEKLKPSWDKIASCCSWSHKSKWIHLYRALLYTSGHSLCFTEIKEADQENKKHKKIFNQ